MTYTISLSAETYQQLEALAIGFDTPENVIRKLLDQYHQSNNSNQHTPDSALQQNHQIYHFDQLNISKNEQLKTHRPVSVDGVDNLEGADQNSEMYEFYVFAKKVYNNTMSIDKACDYLTSKYELSSILTLDYIYTFQKMLEGLCYKRDMTFEITEIYLKNILKDYGKAGLDKALTSVKKHIAYRQSFSNQPSEDLIMLHKTYKEKID